MPEFQTRNLKIAISAAPETVYNTLRVGAADTYLGMLTTGRAFYVPDKEKVDDTGKIGTGAEFPTEQRSTYITVPSMEISDDVNIDTAAILLRRAMGGLDVTSTPSGVTGGANTVTDHTWGLAGTGQRQLPSSSVLWAIPFSGADYIWGGCVVESFAISQTNADVPTFTAGLLGSGLYRRLRYLTANGAAAVNGTNPYTGPYAGASGSEFPPSFPAPIKHRYMIGAESNLLFTPEGGAPYSITGSGQRMKAFSLTLTNNHRTDDRRPGDPRVDSATPRSGHYVNRMNHGDRTIGGSMTVMLDDLLTEFNYAYNDTVLEAFTYTARGNFLKATDTTTETSAQGEFEMVVPACYFRGVAGADDAGDAILTISIFPIYDGVNDPLQARIRNNSTAVIV